MKKIIYLIATMTLISCAGNGTGKVPALNLSNIDTTYTPADDFYEYATHGWQVNNPMRPEFSRYGAFDVLRENNEIRLNDLFADMAETTAEAGTVEQKISDLYKMGMDSVKRNSDGIEPIKADLEEILKAERDNLPELIAKLHIYVSSPFFGAGVGADLTNSSINVLYVSQSGLGMGNRDYYLDSEHEAKREAYVKFMTSAFGYTGIENAEKAAAAVLDLETRMAEKFRSNVQLRDVQANYNPVTYKDFTAKYTGFDWNRYFTALETNPFDSLINEQPEVLEAVCSILEKEPIETIRYYLAAGYIRSAASFLDDRIYSDYFEFFGKTMSGQEEPKPLWKRAMAIPNSVLSEAVGQMYVAKYFPKEQKEKVLGIVKNLQVALGQHIGALDWMSDATKAKAQEKLASFTVKIGYPDKWRDYSTLQIDPSLSYWENVKAASCWGTRDNLNDLGKEVDRERWHMSPQTVNAYYNPTTNEICFPAAILQPPFYNPDADDAVNYGAIGVVIGHEMTHGFDDQGRQFDKDGNLNDWWTKEDAEAFAKKTEILVSQFNAIEVLPGIHADGKLSLGENIADQGGLRVSYTAYRNSLAGNEPAPIDGFTADQRFYLGYATVWAQNIREQEIERLTKVDVHSLGKNRVNATLRNIETFYKAFNITEGKMFLPEDQRVIIW